jgi:hypothetical protein
VPYHQALEMAEKLRRRAFHMDVAYISALSALAGSVVGGLTSGITTRLNQRVQASAERLAHNKSLREDLYKDFIAASKAYGDAIVSNEPQVQELVALYAIISRMRILSSPRIVACADKMMAQRSTPSSCRTRRSASCMN